LISVLILTKNEEADLPRCLASVTWSDDVHVFDSDSTDSTGVVAQRAGAKLHRRTFDGYASQRNAALRSVPFQHAWVLVSDADDEVTSALAAELPLFVRQAPNNVAAARVLRRDHFRGTWLRHAAISPYLVRLIRPDRVQYVREVNEIVETDGEVATLSAPLDHYPFSKGIAHWIRKHNRYSTMEAEVVLREVPPSKWKCVRAIIHATDFNERRRYQKALFYTLPGRPLLKFGYMMCVRCAWRDGRAGISYALLQSIYEYFIVLKTVERRRKYAERLPW
jgi:glycosyltransferase involved in cell wall biosynthesis